MMSKFINSDNCYRLSILCRLTSVTDNRYGTPYFRKYEATVPDVSRRKDMDLLETALIKDYGPIIYINDQK